MITIFTIALVLVVLALCAVIVFLVKTHRDETKDLHLRLASKSLEDYHYWRDAYPLEVEHNRATLEAARREAKPAAPPLTAKEQEGRDAARGF